MGSLENLSKRTPFTSENAREMQKRSAAKQRENIARRKSVKERLLIAFDQKHKLKDGREVDSMDLMVAAWIKKCVDGDIGAIKSAVEQIGEAPAQQHDITSGGEALANPLSGLSLAQLDKRLSAIRKTLRQTKKNGKKGGPANT